MGKNSSFLKHVGEIIRHKRKKAGVTPKTLSKDLDISQSTLSRYENGNTEIGVTMMEKIGKYLKFPMRGYTDTYDDSND
ncbi:helix-turn-helix transcriptional regulator [Butyrivibrio sp.]|uniref:helix-turn-helix domain-containing protein n=1 Tax=Butyrivibrio sp. TaxID=28121 RepID=UPI0025BDE920|nr:helix-turn-helix transcriptional regulator [Butyrivibrio sp.]MBQ7431374.1 helix-turn-helix transcriptional regulator [Butyrivibrio sp.]MBQ9302686.1 helix-turn-helix transcriptional regulator [Butyrivibrio sp.]